MLVAPKKIIKKKYPSPKPLYIIGIGWIVGAFLLPMYKLWPYLVLGVLSVVAWYALKTYVYPDEEKEIEVEIPLNYFSQVQKEFLEKGTASLKNILELNKAIDKPEFNESIKELVNTSDQILDYVYEHEKAASSMRKIVHYYLPTVEKLLKRYDEIEDTTNVANVDTSKQKIEEIVKTTTSAFRKQLNDLYDTDTIDISSDIKVLESIYVKEGLIDPDNK